MGPTRLVQTLHAREVHLLEEVRLLHPHGAKRVLESRAAGGRDAAATEG